MDTVRVIVNQELFGQSLMNVFWYEAMNLGGTSITHEQACDEWWRIHETKWKAFLSADLKFISIEITSMNDPMKPFAIKAIDETGLFGFPAIPSHSSATVKLNVGTRQTRPGSKRFAGCCELHTDANGWSVPFRGWVEEFTDILGATITLKDDFDVDIVDFVPMVYTKPLPLFPNAYIGQRVQSASLNLNIGTQNTRKP
jgi:hypothetical protein